jgi:general stress protein 26
MDLSDKIYEVIKSYPMGALATVGPEGKPRVRFVMLDAGRDLTIRFVTSLSSRKVAQIGKNPEVHIACGASLVDSMAPYIQLEGTASVSRKGEILREMWTEALRNYFTGPDDPDYCVVVVDPYRVEYYSTTITPEVWVADKR